MKLIGTEVESELKVVMRLLAQRLEDRGRNLIHVKYETCQVWAM